MLPSAFFYQLSERQYCSQVTYKEIEKHGFSCNSVKKKPHQAYLAMEKLVFQEAARKQVLIDSCLAESFDSVRQDQNLRDQYTASVALSWLGLKKAQIIRNRCKSFFNTFVPKKTAMTRENFQFLSKQFEKKPVLSLMGFQATMSDLKLIPHCLNWELHLSIQMAESIYTQSLPLHGSMEPFKFLEENRKFITSKVTQKPVTDDELLNLDLSQADKKLNINFEGLAEPANKLLLALKNERDGVAGELKSGLKKGQLNSGVKDYLAESGVVKEVMIEHKMIEVNPETNQITKSTPGAVCINAWSDVTSKSQAIDAAVSFLIPGSFAFKTIGTVGKGFVAQTARIGKSLLYGANSTAHIFFTVPAIKRCIGGKNSASTGNRQIKKEVGFDMNARTTALEQTFGFYSDVFLELDAKQTPTCNLLKNPKDKMDAPVFLQKRVSRGSCFQEVMEFILPTI